MLKNTPHHGSKGRTMTARKTTALTVRLPTSLYDKGKALAELRDTSHNELLTDALKALVSQEEQAALYASFSEVGGDGSNDIGFALAAQSEVLDGLGSGCTPIDHGV
jgi:hypothetical protein